MDEFGWTESDAIKYMGIALAGVAALGVVSYATVGKLCQWIDERLVLIFVGIIPMTIGRLLLMPLPGADHPEVALEDEGEEEMDRGADKKLEQKQIISMCLQTGLISAWLELLPWTQGTSYRNVDCSGEEGPPLCGHDWCGDQPAISKAQFFISFFVGFFGYPYCIALAQGIYSKAIGPRPQV